MTSVAYLVVIFLSQVHNGALMTAAVDPVATLAATGLTNAAFIRTSGEFDGVIDFDATTRDPANPLQFLPAYDSGDHLHPGDAGYRAMGEAVDVGLFRARR